MTQERLGELLSYDKETGKFIRNMKRGRFPAGSEVMPRTDERRGWYPYIKLDDKTYGLHQLAWLYVNNELIVGFRKDSKGMVLDHINGDVSDNRISNLRKVTFAENSRNRTIAKNNKYGSQGLLYNEKSDRWIVNIVYNYDNIHLGSYTSKQEAIAARQGAERALGFHDNHGRKKE